MKILFIAPRYHTNLHFYVKALKDAGHEVEFLSMLKGGSENYEFLEPVVLGTSFFYKQALKLLNLVVKNKAKNNFWRQVLMFAPVFSICKDVKRVNPDVVFVKSFPGLFMIQSLFAVGGKSRKVFAMVQTSKYYGYNLKRKIWLFILKNFFKVKKIITPLKNELEHADDFFLYIPFIIDAKDFKKKYFLNNRINIISVGKFVKRKDHLTLLRAVNNLKNKHDIFLTLIGEKVSDGILSEVKDYIKQNSLEKIVDIKYNIPHSEVLVMYKNFDLFILPSYNEPAAYSIVEAMVSKLPVICSDTCGTKCYIKEGENGYIFKSKDSENLESNIEKIIKNRGNLIEAGIISFEMSKNNHSLRQYIPEVEILLKK